MAQQSQFWKSIPSNWSLVKGSDVYDVNPRYATNGEMNAYLPMDAIDTELPFPSYFGQRIASEHSGKTFTTGDTLFARITLTARYEDPADDFGNEKTVDEAQLDPIRDHARRGDIRDWPVSIRVIYDANKKWVDKSGKAVQLVNEFDILQTERDELYLVLAIFGLEMVINYGGPEIEGYERWLKRHNGVSSLYSGGNEAISDLRPAER